MRACALLSGGKDSNYAIYLAMREGLTVSCAATAGPRSSDSWLFHSVALEATPMQARSMGIAHYYIGVSGEKERELEEMLSGLSRIKEIEKFDVLISGAIASRYQHERFLRLASLLGVRLYAPLWGRDQRSYMRELANSGVRFIISSISTMGLPLRLLGKPIGRDEAEEIIRLSETYGFNPAFEGGEAETLVLDAPHYSRPLCVEGQRRIAGEFVGYVEIERVWLGERGEDCIYVR